MIRSRLTRALSVALTCACLAGTADATVHHGPSWDSHDRWSFDRWDSAFRDHGFGGGFGNHGWDGDFDGGFDGPAFWHGNDRWSFGNDDRWQWLADCLCHSLFNGDDCDETPGGDPGTPVADTPAAVPLPAGLPLLGAGLAALALLRRRRR